MAQDKENRNRNQGHQGSQRDRETMRQDEIRKREERNRAAEQMRNKGEEGGRRDRSKDASRLPE